MNVAWLGHATTLIELDGLRVLTDPVLAHRVGPLVRTAPPVDRGALDPIDAVLLSHLHADHADPRSLRLAARSAAIFAPRGSGGWLRRLGLSRVIELGPGEAATVGRIRIRATPAAHDRRRHPLGPAATPVGYLLEGSASA